MTEKTNQQDQEQEDLQVELKDLQEMLLQKSRENTELLEQLARLNNEVASMNNEVASMKVRTLKVHEENLVLKSNPEIAKQRAAMEYQLDMAKRFVEGKAFARMTPEQAYTLIKAGGEMGMTEVESLNSLYITNGSIDFYGKAMPSVFRAKGYSIQYLDESDEGLTVRVFKESEAGEILEEYTEQVRHNDQILLRSKAMEFASKNKMRYHGLRMIMAFHLPHLFKSVSDPFQAYHLDQQEEANQKRIGAPDKTRTKERFIKWINSPDRKIEDLQDRSTWEMAIDLDCEDELTNREVELSNKKEEE